MQLRLKRIIAIGMASVIAFKLFTFGLHYPYEARVIGDASFYLKIAYQLGSFSSVIHYADIRSIGFPFFEFIIHKILHLFTASNNLLTWVNAICITLFIAHFFAAWCFSTWTRRTNLIKSDNAALLLFMFFATYPALIGHTTTPVSDTLALDLILYTIPLLEHSFNTQKKYWALLLSIIAGCFFGFSILVRPGTLLAIPIALAIGCSISLFSQRRKSMLIAAAILGCAILLMPFTYNCSQKYGNVCLQDPKTFNAVLSAQVGLTGARTLWSKQEQNKRHEGIPTLPDDIMLANYYNRCHLTRIVGLDESSLTGCLVTRPLTLPAYVLKKWVGLFDHFRFTPYLEEYTPLWLVWLSRTYDSLSWIGFALCFFTLFKTITKENRNNIKNHMANNISTVILIAYSAIMLLQHTAFHVEDRYSFPLIPLSAIMLFIYGEKIVQEYNSSLNWRGIYPLFVYCTIALTLFLTQIIIWDRTNFY